eukprot:jgi/Astpho2/9244/Aster-07199
MTDTGLQYQDLREGSGREIQKGDRVTVDWDGYTIEARPPCSAGYYGRPFEARNKTKGGAFAADKDYFSFRVGDQQVGLLDTVIPAFEEGILGMKEGGVRRLIVPPELGYPNNDFRQAGPKPSNFSVGLWTYAQLTPSI